MRNNGEEKKGDRRQHHLAKECTNNRESKTINRCDNVCAYERMQATTSECVVIAAVHILA